MLRLENEALFNKGCNRNFFPTSIGYAFIIKKGQIRSEQESLVTLFETHCSMMCDSKTCRIPFRVEIYLFIYLQEIANDKWNQMSSWKKKNCVPVSCQVLCCTMDQISLFYARHSGGLSISRFNQYKHLLSCG